MTCDCKDLSAVKNNVSLAQCIYRFLFPCSKGFLIYLRQSTKEQTPTYLGISGICSMELFDYFKMTWFSHMSHFSFAAMVFHRGLKEIVKKS